MSRYFPKWYDSTRTHESKKIRGEVCVTRTELGKRQLEVRESCHTDSLSDTSLIFPASHVVSFLSLTVTSRYVYTCSPHPFTHPLPQCIRLIRSLSIVHPSEFEISELIWSWVVNLPPSFIRSLFFDFGRKIYVNESSLCKGNLEQFYHIKQSIVSVLFHLLHFAYSTSVCCWFFFLPFFTLRNSI
jgi:hypothetical protein